MQEEKEMDVFSELENLIGVITKIDEYGDTLSEKESKCDLAEEDILHKMEFDNLNLFQAWAFYQEIKRVRQRRRIIKNNRELIRKFNEQREKLKSDKTVAMLASAIRNKKNEMNNKVYTNRVYSDDFSEILNKGGKKEGEKDIL